MLELTMETAARYGAAAALGMLVGLERERTKPTKTSFAGVRTFSLISIAGAIAGGFFQSDILRSAGLALFCVIALLIIVSHVLTAKAGDHGITTEVSAVISFFIGFLCALGCVPVAAAITITCGLLLSMRDWLHNLAQHIEGPDVTAALKFGIITLIVLPLIPNHNFGIAPLDVINPYKIWLMVVLISGLNFIGYICAKFLGRDKGIELTGFLGGVVSSTAVTLGLSQRSKLEPEQGRMFAFGILIAWTVMFVRVLCIVFLVNRALAVRLVLPTLFLGAVSAVMSFLLWRREHGHATADAHAGSNPFELWQAVKFGLLFGIIILFAKAAEVTMGDTGVYLAGSIAGLTDVDAILLSMAGMASSEPSKMDVAARAIVLAMLANTGMKGAIAMFAGSKTLRKSIGAAFAAFFFAGIAAFFM